MPGLDPIELTTKLVRCASVTPANEGALEIVESTLEAAGFECVWVNRGGIKNLFARWGNKGNAKSFGFNGHTDVVPIGDAADWSMPPFGAEIKDGVMFGRGTTDMKSGVAAFVAAAVDFVTDTPPDGSVVIAITGDEEGDAKDGTTALLDYMAEQGERMDVCLVGEPTCPDTMGQMIKIGRRGSLTVRFKMIGTQGHSAYPHRANNPLPPMMRLMDTLASHVMDEGSEHFDPSTLAVVNVDTGNPANNVIPASCSAVINIRFNDLHSSHSITQWISEEVAKVGDEFGVAIEVQLQVSGESFITPPGALSNLVARSVEAETGVTPELSTSGGTSDARFVKAHCPVVEFGLVGQSMHQVDEHVQVAHIEQLKAIYGRVLRDYFA